MKKLFLLSLMIITPFLYGSPVINQDPEREKIELEVETTTIKEQPPERSLNYAESYIYRNLNVLEFRIYNIGEAFIQVTNSMGEVIYSHNTVTDTPTLLHYPLPRTSESYCIEIHSQKVRAIGYFDIY